MATGDAVSPTALSLLVDLDSGAVSRMEEMTLASAGLKERQDLQRWITEHPDLIAPDLLLITTEFDRWESANTRWLIDSMRSSSTRLGRPSSPNLSATERPTPSSFRPSSTPPIARK